MSRNLFEYHPVTGYRFIPGIRARVRHESGGYLVRCNDAGFRCNHEATRERAPGSTRVLLFGDSYTAGEGVSNGRRFGDLLEQRIDGARVQNFGLPGSGTDQQYLSWREFARDLDADVLLLCPMVENVRRNLQTARLTQSAHGAGFVMRAKPYFELRGAELELCNAPVPKGAQPVDEGAEPEPSALRRALRQANRTVDRWLPGFRGVTQRLRRISLPVEYTSADHPGWRLMRAILLRWIAESRVPAVLCPLPTFAHVEGSIRSDDYRERFAELARDAQVEWIDVLPAFHALSAEERRACRFPLDEHPTRRGHELLADAIAPRLRARLTRKERAA
jgi:lysophospholipase L1-like esterase